MKSEAYMDTIKEAALSMAMDGHKYAEHAALIELRMTFTTMEQDEDERTDITMSKVYNAMVIQLTDGTFRVDDTQSWEVTTEEEWS